MGIESHSQFGGKDSEQKKSQRKKIEKIRGKYSRLRDMKYGRCR